jgi:hypothetical protein
VGKAGKACPNTAEPIVMTTTPTIASQPIRLIPRTVIRILSSCHQNLAYWIIDATYANR